MEGSGLDDVRLHFYLVVLVPCTRCEVEGSGLDNVRLIILLFSYLVLTRVTVKWKDLI